MMHTRWRGVIVAGLFSALLLPAVWADSPNSSEGGQFLLKEGILPLTEDISQTARKFREMLETFKEYHSSKNGNTRHTLQIVPPPHEFDQKAVVEPDDSVQYHMIIVNPGIRKHVHKFFPQFPKHPPR
jgi:hypothetical protein